jgi:hypothetical protein
MYQYVMNGCGCRAGSNSVGNRRAAKNLDDRVGRAEISALHALRVSFKNAKLNNQEVNVK